MRRFFIFILTIVFVQAADAQDASSIEWGKPITFSDFEASPAPKDTAAANISVTILLGYSNGPAGILEFRVTAVMDKDESWIQKEFRTNTEVLEHEQGHFDIAHIYAKRLAAALKGKRYKQTDVKQLHEIYDRFLASMDELQVRYDRETKGGMKSTAQAQWQKFIQRELGFIE